MALKAKGFIIDFPSKKETLFEKAISLLNGKVGFEAKDLKYNEYEELNKKLKTVKPIKNLVEYLRIIKDNNEISKIKKAVQITDKVFAETLGYLKPRQTELKVARKICDLVIKYGAQDISFPPIVAFGKNSARPHYKIGETKLKKNGILLLDLGVKYKGYCSDLTRTIYIGEPDRKFEKIYKAVLEAQSAAIKTIKPGIKAKDIHNTVVKVFKRKRLENKFIHSTGHGIGLDVHEHPSIYANSSAVLKEGMVITIEPGIYIEGWGGVRIENVVLITKNGSEILSKAPKAIIH
jgi:Xaa-Pro aminopeptidase